MTVRAPRGRGWATAVLWAATVGCAAAAEIPERTVPQAERLDVRGREGYLDAMERAAAGDVDAALAALDAGARVRPVHVPTHLLRQDLLRLRGGESALRDAYAGFAAAAPGDSGAALLEARAGEGDAAAGYAVAASLSASDPWPRIALAVAGAERARALDEEAEMRAREGFRDEQGRLRAAATAAVERARGDARAAAALEPGLAAAHGTLAWVESVAADLRGLEPGMRRPILDRALTSATEALRLDPGDARLRWTRAMVLRAIGGRGAEAEADLRVAAALRPGDADIAVALARVLSEGASPAAPEAWAAAARLRPGDGDLLVDWGSALLARDRVEEALERFREARAAYDADGGPRWRALRGEFTALAQGGLDGADGELLRRARAVLADYRAAGGPDREWADGFERLLSGE